MMMEKRSEEIPWSLLSLLLLWLPGLLCSAKETTMLMLDSRALCADSHSSFVRWASKEKDMVVIGRGAPDRQLFADCSVVIGVASAQSHVLQLTFQAFHVGDCGVTVVVNQSQRSDFTTSRPMTKMGCQHGKVGVLHSQEKHYVKISVHKDNAQLQQYNFRINITVVDVPPPQRLTQTESSVRGAQLPRGTVSELLRAVASHTLDANYLELSVNGSDDKLRATGPETHVVIIVGVTVVIVVSTALWLLVKYLIHRSQRWQEHCAERNMERAIRLYNSQESPQDSDYMYTALPPHDNHYRQSAPNRNNHAHPSKNVGGRGGGRHHRAGDITFVHADGHIETFRMRSSPQERRHLGDPAPGPQQVPPGGVVAAQPPPAGSTGSAPRQGERHREGGGGEGAVDVAGECPPSYEEALRMPTMHSCPSPLYVNLDAADDDAHPTTTTTP